MTKIFRLLIFPMIGQKKIFWQYDLLHTMLAQVLIFMRSSALLFKLPVLFLDFMKFSGTFYFISGEKVSKLFVERYFRKS